MAWSHKGIVLRKRLLLVSVLLRHMGWQGLASLVCLGRWREWHQDLMDHRILKAHILVIKRRTEVLLRHEFVPFPLRVQILIEETKRCHVGVRQLT